MTSKKSQHFFLHSLAFSFPEQGIKRLFQCHSAHDSCCHSNETSLAKQKKNLFHSAIYFYRYYKVKLDFLWINFFLWTLLGVQGLMPSKPKLYH